MSKLLNISEAAKILGVLESTLRRWERKGRLLHKLFDGMIKAVEDSKQ